MQLVRIAVADRLWERGAVLTRHQSKDGRPVRPDESPDELGFLLKLHERNPSAPRSPVFFNLRTPDNPKPGPLLPHDVAAIGELLYHVTSDMHVGFDAVAGVPNAGDPFAAAIARRANARLERQIYRLTLAKGEVGEQRRIGGIVEGSAEPGSRILLVDDLVTKADSKVEALQQLRCAGYEVSDAIVLIDREQGGREELEAMGVRLYAAFTARALFTLYADMGCVDECTYHEVMEYFKAA